MSDPSPYYRKAREEGFGFYYDPLYGYIPLNELLRQAIDLPEVQRLRHLHQLAVLSLVFPGATHSRFSHSIGLSYLCEVEWNNLIHKRKSFQIGKDEEINLGQNLLLAIQLASIFHDVGHGPFSHIFEMFCERYQKYGEFTHEQITRRLITKGIGEYRNIPFFLNELCKQKKDYMSPGELELFSPESIANLVEGNPPVSKEYADYAFLGQLLHSPYDIDRLDYLRRDAYYTGVEIGGVDVWEIIYNFLIYKDKQTNILNLGIDIKAAEAIEALLFARDLAYRKVYYNIAHRSNQELIIRGIQNLIESGEDNISTLVLNDDYELIEKFQKRGVITKEIADRIKKRRLYEPLPIKLNLDADFDKTSRARRADIWKIKYQEVMDKEEELSKDCSIWENNNRIIFDYELVPVAEDNNYTECYLFDTITGESCSLLKALPHLELIYGEYKQPGVPISLLGPLYRNKQSNFFVYVPYEFIDESVQKMNKKIQESGIEKNDEKIIPFIENDCTDILDPFQKICEAFVTLVNIPKEKQSELLNHFKKQMVTYLNKLRTV